jgi:hypothetical protein
MLHKHAAVIMSGGKAITMGYNHDRMTSQKKFIMSYHAEIHALDKFIGKSSFVKNYLNDTTRSICVKKQYPKGAFAPPLK